MERGLNTRATQGNGRSFRTRHAIPDYAICLKFRHRTRLGIGEVPEGGWFTLGWDWGPFLYIQTGLRKKARHRPGRRDQHAVLSGNILLDWHERGR